MHKKKVCKKCKIFVEGDVCPLCGGKELTETWKGRIIILKPEKSVIAKKLKIGKKGAYAIKTK